MLKGKDAIICLIAGYIKKTYKWVNISKTKIFRNKCKSWVDLSNYATKRFKKSSMSWYIIFC